VSGCEENALVLKSKTRPKRLVLKGDDGRDYAYLLKGREDLHLDQRIMQVMMKMMMKRRMVMVMRMRMMRMRMMMMMMMMIQK
jgi:hypothetical protein